jgi:hypothetical protein
VLVEKSAYLSRQGQFKKEKKLMDKIFDELTKSLAQSITRKAMLKKFGVRLVGMTLLCFRVGMMAQAQTTIVCDPAGDTTLRNGKVSPDVPSWLDITRAEVSDDFTGNILFTLTVKDRIPAFPAWSSFDEGGQLWWGWRIVGDFASDFTVQNGCLKSAGHSVLAGYFLDLIWDVTSSSFYARLVDDTSCNESDVPFIFSNDRTQVTLVVAKSQFANRTLIPNPNQFQFLAATDGWKASSTGNQSFFHIDLTPDENSGQLVPVTWSAAGSGTYNCP